METIKAIYTNGVFRPLNPVPDGLVEGDTVQIELKDSPSSEGDVNPIMKIAENFYEGLTDEDIEEIERIALDRSNFFGDRKP